MGSDHHARAGRAPAGLARRADPVHLHVINLPRGQAGKRDPRRGRLRGLQEITIMRRLLPIMPRKITSNAPMIIINAAMLVIMRGGK